MKWAVKVFSATDPPALKAPGHNNAGQRLGRFHKTRRGNRKTTRTQTSTHQGVLTSAVPGSIVSHLLANVSQKHDDSDHVNDACTAQPTPPHPHRLSTPQAGSPREARAQSRTPGACSRGLPCAPLTDTPRSGASIPDRARNTLNKSGENARLCHRT